MIEYLGVIIFWLLLMALIGAALLLVPKISAGIDKARKTEKDDNIQDIADE